MSKQPLAPAFDASRANLDQLIQKLRQDRGASPSDAIPRRPRGGSRPPASSAQRRLWLLDRLEPGTSAYNMPGLVHLAGPVETGALAGALAEVADRHEALRTTFEAIDGEPVQVIHPPRPPALPEIDLRALELAAASAELARLGEAEGRRGFDLETFSLFRAALLRLGNERSALLLVLHHAVADGWSLGILLRELAALYGVHTGNGPADLAELPLQYPDYALWQRERLESPALEGELAYWRERLAGLEPLDLPSDAPRSKRSAAERVSLRVGAAETAGVRELARRLGATPMAVLSAAWAAFLGRLASSTDVAFGLPVAGRKRRDLQDLIGFFVNTLVLRIDLGGALSFKALAERSRDALLEAEAHQDLPFERLVEELAPERSLARTPLIQAIFSFDERPPAVSAGGVSFETEFLAPGRAKFDLSVALEPRGGEILGILEARRDRFSRSTARRWAAQFQRFLAAAVASPGRDVLALPLWGEGERHQILFEWQGEPALPARGVLERFEAQARRRPEAPAVETAEGCLSYARLDAVAAALAEEIRALRPAGPEPLVAVLCARTTEFVIALVAAFKAGCAYLPIDPSLPLDRVRWMLDDAGVGAVLAGPEAEVFGDPLGRPRLAIRRDAEQAPDASPTRPFDPQSRAYVIYTSGSTGRPKGVELHHGGLANLVAWHRRAYGAGLGDRWTQLASPAFDAATWEVWAGLALGSTLVVVPDEAVADPAALGRWLAEAEIDLAHLPTPLAEALFEAGLPELPRLRRLLVGSDRLHRVPADLPFELVNQYGPTEATVLSTWGAATPGMEAPPIGRALDGVRTWVLDRRGRPVPLGSVGELWIGGAGVGRGYLGRPAWTAGRFVPDPFSAEAGARAYRSGDLVRQLADGRLSFVGRGDHQVKVRGFRIELGEVESALRALDGVREAVAAAPADRRGDRRLVAFVSGEARPGEIREELGRRLPGYMVPPTIEAMAELPRLVSGKVDRGALSRRAREMRSTGGETAALPPSTPAEEMVAAIFAEVLELDQPVGRSWGVESSFFELGGHSLLASRVISRLREAFGVELPLARLFAEPTVRELARSAVEETAAGFSLPGLERIERRGPAPASFSQERVWFLQRLEPDSAAYNMPGRVRLRGALAGEALEKAFAELSSRHEVLRTRLVEKRGEPVQIVEETGAFVLPRVDLSALNGADAERLAQGLARRWASRPFDVEGGPLWRVLLVRTAKEDHTLLLVMHHAISDGWSVGILAREVGELYCTLVAEHRPHLPELPVQYADYAAWQRSWLRGEVLEEQLGYWRETVVGVPLLELPVDRPRRTDSKRPGAVLPVALEGEGARRLGEWARAEGATPFMVSMAAWQVTMGRLAGQDDLAVGTPVAGRRRLELEGLIGFFVNTLAIRAELAPGMAFRDHLRRVRERVLAADPRQDLPFERLVEELSPERHLETTPIFQVMLAFQNAPRPAPELAGLEASWEEISSGAAKFELTLSLEEASRGLAGSLEYRRDLFDRTTVSRFLRTFETLLEGAIAEPGSRLEELPLLSVAERQQVEVEWQGDHTPTPSPAQPLHTFFVEQAARTPERLALTAEGGSLSYGELERRSRALACHLVKQGVEAEERIGICLDRGPELVVAILGVLRAGAVYVPLDPAYPEERLTFTVDDAGAQRVLGRGGVLSPELSELELEEVDPGRLAYVIYTSGSTGRPKGVAIEHASASALAEWALGAFSAEELEATLFATSICFDLSVFELFVTLAAGGRLVVAENALAFSELPERHRVTLVNTVPSAIAELVAHGELPASVRTVNLAGEPLRRRLVESIYASSQAGRVANLYGPSEDTTYSTWVSVAPGEEAEPTIGRPVAGTRARVLDRRGRPVPVGVVGDLHLGGAGLARGYLGRPALTAERFLPDARAETPGARLYRTGDLVRQGPGGELVFLGRVDHQVKVRGFRIELGEVEAALLAEPGVETAALLALGEAGERRLVAFVVPATGAELEATALAASLARRLPAHMVPSFFHLLDELPLLPNGKIDRQVLRRLVGGRTVPRAESGPPRGATEELLAAIWAQVLGLEEIGAEDDFFRLGGHSLAASRVVARMVETLGVELPLRAIFEAPTVRALAAEVDSLRSAEVPKPPPLMPAEREVFGDDPELASAPLSFAQERMWLLERLGPGAAYHLPVALELEGELDAAALAAAVAEIARRHEVLRTTFRTLDGRPVQVIAPPAGSPVLPRADLGRLEGEERERALGALLAGLSKKPFDLGRGPLFRALLVRAGADRHVLLWVLHHAVADGFSLGVLERELGALYGAYAAGRPSPLPELAVQYADFALWQRSWLRDETLERELAWWRRELAGLQPLELPTDRPRPPVKGTRGASLVARLPAGLGAGLQRLGRERGATLFMVLLAVFQALLGRLTSSSETAVGTPSAGRDRLELENLVGFFVNTLVLRGSCGTGRSFTEVLGSVRQTSLGAWAHQAVPFEKLVSELAPARDLSRSPLFQVAFALQSGLAAAPELEGLEVSVYPAPTESAKFDLTLTLVETPEGLEAAAEYDRDLFDATTIRRLLGHYQHLLEAVAAEPERRLGELPILTAGERHQLAREWNDTAPTAEPGVETVLELVSGRMNATPEAVAVEAASAGHVVERWTYGELRRRARAIAARLDRLGSFTHSLETPVVAICSERSPALVAAALGILKAGGAYLPLDPQYPDERLAYMLRDSGAVAVLTRSAHAHRFAGLDLEVLTLSAAAEGEGGEVKRPPSPETLAYVIYTSGSTGKPKGVAVSHRTLLGLVRWHLDAYDLGPGDRTALVAGPAFDASVWEIWPCLAAGATLAVAPREMRAAPGELARWLVGEGITSTFLPTPLAEAVLARPWPEGGSLRTLLTGGDRLRLRPRPEHPFALVNHYGPTENTVVATAGAVACEGREAPTIGRPIDRVEAHVFDRQFRPVTLGSAGELVLGGTALARGYLGRPALTAERFLPDESSPRPGGRLYRTGDLVRLRPDGELEFLGRVDHQVKVRGFRIELGEIEAALAEHPALAEAVVLALEEKGERRLVACVVKTEAPEIDAAELRRWLNRGLPEYMVPAAFVAFDELPLTPNGKIDRKELAERAAKALGDLPAVVPYAAPESALERRVAGVWREVLGAERVGRDENFFEIGGDSLKMAQAAERLEAELGRRVAVVDAFRFPTVRTLARHLSAAEAGEEKVLREAGESARRRREATDRRRQRRARRLQKV